MPFNNSSDKLCAPCAVLGSCEVGGVTTRLLAPRPERGAWKCKPERDEVEIMSSTKATSNGGDVECQTGLGPCSSSVCYFAGAEQQNFEFNTAASGGAEGCKQTHGVSPTETLIYLTPASLPLCFSQMCLPLQMGLPLSYCGTLPTQPTAAATPALAGFSHQRTTWVYWAEVSKLCQHCALRVKMANISERLSDLPKATQLRSKRSRI